MTSIFLPVEGTLYVRETNRVRCQVGHGFYPLSKGQFVPSMVRSLTDFGEVLRKEAFQWRSQYIFYHMLADGQIRFSLVAIDGDNPLAAVGIDAGVEMLVGSKKVTFLVQGRGSWDYLLINSAVLHSHETLWKGGGWRTSYVFEPKAARIKFWTCLEEAPGDHLVCEVSTNPLYPTVLMAIHQVLPGIGKVANLPVLPMPRWLLPQYRTQTAYDIVAEDLATRTPPVTPSLLLPENNVYALLGED